jgi:hypothetical protein
MKYRIDRGGQARTIKGAEARRNIARLMHGAAVALEVTPQHADWHYDLRRGRLRIYGSLLRYIDTAIQQGKSKDEVKLIPQWIAAYIDEQFAPTPAAALKLVA